MTEQKPMTYLDYLITYLKLTGKLQFSLAKYHSMNFSRFNKKYLEDEIIGTINNLQLLLESIKEIIQGE